MIRLCQRGGTTSPLVCSATDPSHGFHPLNRNDTGRSCRRIGKQRRRAGGSGGYGLYPVLDLHRHVCRH